MFKENEHPRDKDGKFTDGSSGNEEKSAEEIAKEIFPHLTNGENLDRMGVDRPVVASIYVNSADPLNKYAEKIEPIPGYEDMIIHGGSDVVQLRDSNDEVASEYSAKEFAEILTEDPNYHGGDIRLISCSTGAGEECFAQQLADELGVNVMAPSDIVIIYPDGRMKIHSDSTHKKGEWRVFAPRSIK